MSHKYYEQEFDTNNTQRLLYFDSHFESLANEIAIAKGISLSQYLSQIRNFTTFKEILMEVFSQDSSLANYVEGMSQRGFRLFFDRQIIQEILSANLEGEEDIIEETILPPPSPIDVKQVEKKNREFFRATYKEKKTGKIRRVIGYESTFKIKSKKTTRLRDSSGKFVKRT